MFNNLDAINTRNSSYRQLGDDALTRVNAQQLFDSRVGEGRRRRILATLTRRSTRLLSLCKSLNARPQYTGIHVVPLDQIRGTENRSDEFDADFYPVREHIEKRWINVAIAFLRGDKLPPVELLQYGDDYYVRDGHHRISVARALGQTVIDAEVTVLAV